MELHSADYRALYSTWLATLDLCWWHKMHVAVMVGDMHVQPHARAGKTQDTNSMGNLSSKHSSTRAILWSEAPPGPFGLSTII